MKEFHKNWGLEVLFSFFHSLKEVAKSFPESVLTLWDMVSNFAKNEL
jgi:hypothetical protein